MTSSIKWLGIVLSLFLASSAMAATSYSSRRSESSATFSSRSYPSNRGYSLFKNPRYYASSRYSSTHSIAAPVPSASYPGGSQKRTMYTGRYCAYTKTKMVPHRVPNGTETYTKQVVSKCHWSAVYCKPRVDYVVATRRKYKTVMKEVTQEEWGCCPGFEGENCENVCFNCTKMSELQDKVAELEDRLLNGNGPLEVTSPSRRRLRKGPKGDQGPVGPRGSAGSDGEVGPRGPSGPIGQKGERGTPGIKGAVGPRGSIGRKGEIGETGAPGQRGPVGPGGKDGQNGAKGDTGLPGLKGEVGPPGPVGPQGENGERGLPGIDGIDGDEGPRGLEGPIGPRGEKGESGAKGEPGPPGQCGCQTNDIPTQTSTAPPMTTAGSLACYYEGEYYTEDKMWKNENCEECFCMDGSVSCMKIGCPPLDCEYKYKPEGYCCEVCCRNQGNWSESSSGFSGDSDGAFETISSETMEEIFFNYSDTELDNIIAEPPVGLELDSLGCPVTTIGNTEPPEIQIVDRCHLRKDSGPCSRQYERYYYDKVQQECLPFTYGGCEGNGNSFVSLKECKETCINPDQPEPTPEGPSDLVSDPCDDVPADKGKCKMFEYRFTYYKETGRCHRYQFRGCGTSKNIFDQPDDCKTACKAGNPEYPGFITNEGWISVPNPPKDLNGPAELNGYPRFDEVPRRCQQPKYVGKCRASLKRFYYDATEDRCKMFVYGGCKANGNNFVTPWECREVCQGQDPVLHDENDVCSLPMVIGPCRATYSRYYYNSNTRACEHFDYGGCGGNANRFRTRESCENRCVSDEVTEALQIEGSPSCSEPLDYGPCKGHVYRFYYDSNTERCSVFVYSGCGGSKNNFLTPEECKLACGGQTVNYTVVMPKPQWESNVQLQVNTTFNDQVVSQGPSGSPGIGIKDEQEASKPSMTPEIKLNGERVPPEPAGPSGSAIKGEQGPPGPPGPPGIGIKGEQGLPGPQGPKGEPASLESLKKEIDSLKIQYEQLTKMILGHVADMDHHIDTSHPEQANDYVTTEYENPDLEFLSSRSVGGDSTDDFYWDDTES